MLIQCIKCRVTTGAGRVDQLFGDDPRLRLGGQAQLTITPQGTKMETDPELRRPRRRHPVKGRLTRRPPFPRRAVTGLLGGLVGITGA